MVDYKVYFKGWADNSHPGKDILYHFTVHKGHSNIVTETGLAWSGHNASQVYSEFYAMNKGLEVVLADLKEQRAKEKALEAGEPWSGYHLRVFSETQIVVKIMNRHWKPQLSTIYHKITVESFALLKQLRGMGVRVAFNCLSNATR